MAKLKRFSGTPVSEGVRLEVGKYTVFAVRNAQKDVAVRMRREPRRFLRACMRVPFLRGIVRLLRDVIRLFDGLNESAELTPHRPVRGTAAEKGIARALHVHPQTIVAWMSAILIPILLFLGIYAAPAGAEALLLSRFALNRSAVNGIVCAVRILGTLCAIALAGRLRVVRRLLMYKGAINKLINCYECRDEISAENAAQYPIHTRRSESAYLLCLMILCMIFFSWLRVDGVFSMLAVRIGIVLLTAALFNEPFSALEGAELTLPVRIVRAPIDFLQHLMTLEPHPQMLEVAVCAFEAVLSDDASSEDAASVDLPSENDEEVNSL